MNPQLYTDAEIDTIVRLLRERLIARQHNPTVALDQLAGPSGTCFVIFLAGAGSKEFGQQLANFAISGADGTLGEVQLTPTRRDLDAGSN